VLYVGRSPATGDGIGGWWVGGPWPLPGPISLKILKIYLIFKFVIFFSYFNP
jgi:hypothetical protein